MLARLVKFVLASVLLVIVTLARILDRGVVWGGSVLHFRRSFVGLVVTITWLPCH
jgi:hypothetical protein